MRARPRSLLIRATAGSLLCLVYSCSGPGTVLVERVVDGDTIKLADGTRVRYIGVDTPETVRPGSPVEFMGKEASAFNRDLVEGRRVRLEYDVQRLDKYGRTLAYVYLDTLFVNAELVRLGYAQILTIPPNVRYAERFRRLEQEAREANRGLWDEGAEQAWRSAGGGSN